MTAAGVAQIAGGTLLMLLLGAIELVINLVRSGFTWFGNALSITESTAATSVPVLLIIGLVSGGILILRGCRNYKLASRFRRVARTVGDNNHISLINLERRLFWTRPKLLRALGKQMKQGFWPNAHIDMTNEAFLVDYNPVFVQADSGDSTVDGQIADVNGIIHEISSAARQINDAALKTQAERLADIAGQIYTYVAKHPEKAGNVRRLSNYFLPTTATLLLKYVEVQNQPVKTPSMLDAMNKITEVMSTLEDVYHNQLDALYSEKALDVDVEIEVLQNMAGM